MLVDVKVNGLRGAIGAVQCLVSRYYLYVPFHPGGRPESKVLQPSWQELKILEAIMVLCSFKVRHYFNVVLYVG